MKKVKTSLIVFGISMLILNSCRKLIEIEPPNDTIKTIQVFSDDVQATSAMAGLYYSLINNPSSPFATHLSVLAGVGADELIPFDQTNIAVLPFFNNELNAQNSFIYDMWSSVYNNIYVCNSVLENLESDGSTVSVAVKQRLIAEARFIRAFCYFNLVNLWGAVPLVRSTNWQKTSSLTRSPVDVVYQAVISDLNAALPDLPDNFDVAGGERILPTRWAAAALLAKVCVYTKEWEKAIIQADLLLEGNSLFNLETLDNVFTIKSREAIWQLKQEPITNTIWGSPLGVLFIPSTLNSDIAPTYYLTTSLLTAFSAEDHRLAHWVLGTKYTINNTVYYIPYKYKMGVEQTGTQYSEYQTVLRLADIYLLRAEAKLNIGNIAGSVQDLNKIRQRAGLLPLPENIDKELLMDSLMHERRLELFTEFGNRWMDLNRWNKTALALGDKPEASFQLTDALYPIPVSEIRTNPNSSQNAGYE